MQYLSKLIKTDLGFGYSLKDGIASHDRADVWTLNNGTSKENGSPALVHSYEPAKARVGLGPPKAELAKNGLLRLKTLRHPDILKFLSSVEGGDGTLLVATEPATPLATLLSSGVKLDRDAIIWGLFTVSRALGFMHQSGLIHGRVNASTIFVTPSGDWRLGGLEAVTKHANAASLSQYVQLQSEAYRSPEYAVSNWRQVTDMPASAIDSWALGCLMYEAHSGSLNSPDQLRNTQCLPKPLLSAYQKLLSSGSQSRAPAGEVPNHPYFKNSKFVELNLFVENLALKGQLEREAFLGKLPMIMDRLPDSFCTFKILPMLSQSIETGAGATTAFACVVKMKSRLSEASFGTDVAAKYGMKWYSNNQLDRTLRVQMFSKLDLFVPHFDPKDLNGSIFTAMCSAFQDMQAPALRDAAVKAVLNIAPYLSEKNLNSSLMSHFARLQVDPEPAIRTNTTVCLGKLAAKLTEHSRAKVLIPAFLRALKDPFPPARAAGVNAILLTSDYYNMKDVATRVLPAVSPLLVDGAEDVRNIAFKVLEGFVTKLTNNAARMTKAGVQAPSGANGTAGGRQQSSASGWGLSSFTSMTVALLSKGDTNDDKPSAPTTGISSQSYKTGATAVATNKHSISYDSPTSSTNSKASAVPAAYSSAPLTTNTMNLGSQNSFGANSNRSSTFDNDFADAADNLDDDDGDGWGDMDVRADTGTVKNEEDLFVSMMAPTNRIKPSSSNNSGTSGWNTSTSGSMSMKPPAKTKPAARTNFSSLESTVSRASSRKKKTAGGGGDDWEAFLGGSGSSAKKKTGR